MPSKMHKMLVDLISRKMIEKGYIIVASEGNYFPLKNEFNIKLPPKIIRHRPDVIGIDPDEKRICIGEAKTHSDLFSARTIEQFVDFSNVTNNATKKEIELFIGIPLRSRELLSEIFRKNGISNKNIDIVYLPEELVDDGNEDQV